MSIVNISNDKIPLAGCFVQNKEDLFDCWITARALAMRMHVNWDVPGEQHTSKGSHLGSCSSRVEPHTITCCVAHVLLATMSVQAPPAVSVPDPKLDPTELASSLPQAQLENLRYKVIQIMDSIGNLIMTLNTPHGVGVAGGLAGWQVSPGFQYKV